MARARDASPYIEFVSRLVEDIEAGRLLVPRFQRPLQWDIDRKLELLRSIRTGIPIGAVMIWRTFNSQMAVFEEIGQRPLPPPKVGAPKVYLLDGVQRLTTLFHALVKDTRDIEDSDEEYVFVFDLKQDDFLAVTPKELEGSEPPLLPLHALTNGIEILRFERRLQGEDAGAWIDTIDALAQRFREYKVPVIPLESDDLEFAARTFKAINSQGLKMQELDMVHALTWRQGFDLRDKLDAIRSDHLEPVGWKELDDEVILKTLRIAAGLDPYSATTEQVSDALKNRPQILEVVTESLVQTILILAEYQFYSPKIVPYKLQIVQLADAFQHKPSMDAQIKDTLYCWFMLSGYGELFQGLSGYRQQRVTQDVRAILRDGKVRWTGPRPFARRPLKRFDFRSARSKLMAYSLAQSQDKHRKKEKGESLSTYSSARRLAVEGYEFIHQGFPRNRTERDAFSSPGNRFMIASDELPDFRSRLVDGNLTRSDLERHQIPANVWREYCKNRNITNLVRRRAECMDALEAQLVAGFLSKIDFVDYGA